MTELSSGAMCLRSTRHRVHHPIISADIPLRTASEMPPYCAGLRTEQASGLSLPATAQRTVELHVRTQFLALGFCQQYPLVK